MAAEDKTPGEGSVTPAAPKKAATKRRLAAVRDDSHVGQVLRTVYQDAVKEDIPSEMLDLLSKLD